MTEPREILALYSPLVFIRASPHAIQSQANVPGRSADADKTPHEEVLAVW